MAKVIRSPKGVAKYPYLSEPDYKFDADGLFKVDHVVPLNDETQAYIDSIQEMFDEAYKAECASKGKKSLKRAELPWEIDEDEGTVTFKYKLKAKIESKKKGKVIHRKVAIFDAKGKPVNPKSIKIGGGSVIKIGWEPYFWFSPSVGFGLQLQMGAVQVIELKEFGGRDFGFGEEEGFDGSDLPEGDDDAPFDADEGEADEGDDEDF